MTDSLPSFLSADVRLGAALEALAGAIGDLEVQQKKLDTLGGRVVALAKANSAEWSPTARSALSSLTARLALQQKTLDQTRAAFAAARDAVQANGRAHDLALEQYRERELARYQTMQVMTRRQGALARVLHSLIEQRRREAGMPDPDSEDYVLMKGAYDYIPFDVNRFLDLLGRLDTILSLDAAYADPRLRYRPVRFLEAGAGPGRNMMLLKASQLMLIESVAGIDLNGLQVSNGQVAFGLEDSLFVADALAFDYAPYDVIFSYRLFRDDAMQAQLEAQVVATMRVGAYLLAPFPFDLTLHPGLEAVDPDFDIWKKVR
ncbi:hypothetical protein ACFO5X_23025 [Seohaeicola nanhaiensis]|uniref:Class I SAM-dependent methyltransferase n=1 Tax=Seohaeicola nanhaiensis TaxID=1387282 RepID=A0ABV9KMQ2_9RHOB